MLLAVLNIKPPPACMHKSITNNHLPPGSPHKAARSARSPQFACLYFFPHTIACHKYTIVGLFKFIPVFLSPSSSLPLYKLKHPPSSPTRTPSPLSRHFLAAGSHGFGRIRMVSNNRKMVDDAASLRIKVSPQIMLPSMLFRQISRLLFFFLLIH